MQLKKIQYKSYDGYWHTFLPSVKNDKHLTTRCLFVVQHRKKIVFIGYSFIRKILNANL